MARRSDLNKSLKQFFTNRFVLYFFTILAFVHVVGYIAAAQYDALIFFVVVGLLSTNFTKNLSLVFLSAIVLTNLIYFRGMSRYMNSLEGFEGKSGKSKKSKESMTNNKRKQTDNDEDDDDKDADTDRIDQKEQLKNQYKRLEGLMNSDGLKKMTHDSKELMESQSKLMENMKSMEPMINSVQGMVDKFGGMDKLLGMADKLSSGSSQLKGAAFK
jgi:hypothetical protein